MEKRMSFVSIDFETLQAITIKGTECLRMPIQIGMVKYIDGQQTGDVFSCYIDPPVFRPWASYFKIAITSEHCTGAKTFEELYPEILDFIGDLPLVSFSRSTEVDAFREACDYYGLPNEFPKDRFIDPYTQCLAAYKHPTRKSEWHSGLSYWYDYFRLGDGTHTAHHAGDDALMCARLYLHLQTLDLDALLERRPPHPAWFQAKDVKKDHTLFGDPIPGTEALHPGNPLMGKYICLTGFECEIENSLNLKLKQLGAGRLDDPKKCMDILVYTPNYIEKYAYKKTSKLAKAVKNGKQLMAMDELKDILVSLDMYEGEMDAEKG